MEQGHDACEWPRSADDVAKQQVAGDLLVSVVASNGSWWRDGWCYYIPAPGEPTGDVECIAPPSGVAGLPSELEEATETLDRIARYLDECGAPTEVAHPDTLRMMRPALPWRVAELDRKRRARAETWRRLVGELQQELATAHAEVERLRAELAGKGEVADG